MLINSSHNISTIPLQFLHLFLYYNNPYEIHKKYNYHQSFTITSLVITLSMIHKNLMVIISI